MHTKNFIPPVLPEDKSVATDKWFEKFVDDIKTDHLMYSTGVATQEKTQLYNNLIFGSQFDVVSKMRDTSSQFFITQIVTDYITELKSEKKPIRLALGLTEAKILVWAVIDDNDEAMEDMLLIAEAKVNGKYQRHGFYLTSTIIEKSDCVDVPSHYQSLI